MGFFLNCYVLSCNTNSIFFIYSSLSRATVTLLLSARINKILGIFLQNLVVPQDLAIESIINRWTLIEKNTNISMEDFISAIKLILSSTFFTILQFFNNKTYRQIFGTPMGSPLSPIIADIVLQDLEEKAL